MCVIFVIEDGKFPDLETLKSAESLNSHGAGISYIKNGLVHYEKGLDAEKIDAIIKNGNIGKKAIIHFRIASVGEVSKNLCHPFPISQNAELSLKGTSENGVLFHNGTLSDYTEYALGFIKNYAIPLPKGELSDSRVMAWLTNAYGTSWLRLLKHQKIAIMTKKGIKKYGEWTKVKEFTVSNSYFDKSTTTSYYNEKDWANQYGYWKGGVWHRYPESDCMECWGAFKCPAHKDKPALTDDDQILQEGKKKNNVSLDQYRDILDEQIDRIIADGGITEENTVTLNEDPIQDASLAGKPYGEEYYYP